MKAIGGGKSIIGMVRAKAGQIIVRLNRQAPFAKSSPSTDSEGQRFAALDPTVGLFGDADRASDGETRLPLAVRLERSVIDMEERTYALRERANYLVQRIAERGDGEVTLIIHGVRFLIGAAWAGIALWLYFAAAGLAPLNAMTQEMPPADALTLARVFLAVGAAGIGVAFLVAAMVQFAGNGGNRKVRREAESLGHYIAETARDFDRDLVALRTEMDRRAHSADAINDISRAHLTALEACAYFRDISFITGAEGADAERRFRYFLARPGGPAPAGPVFVLGFLIGALTAVVLFAPKPEIVLPAPPEIAQYPWALNWLLVGGFFYAIAGSAISLARRPLAAGAMARARADALDALRGAFTARQAPRPADVVQRIEDAMDVFRARVGGRTTASNHGEKNQAAGALSGGDDEVPHWRRRDSAAQFVETGFQAAPEHWRTDAYEKKLSPEPGAKRGLARLKKAPRD